MSSKGKFAKMINDNMVLLTGVPLIIGIHWGWLKLQKVPHLVDQSHPKELPIVAAAHAFKEKLTGSNVQKGE